MLTFPAASHIPNFSPRGGGEGVIWVPQPFPAAPKPRTGWKACATEFEFLVFSTRFLFKAVDLIKE
jgi:hypothetical protein